MFSIFVGGKKFEFFKSLKFNRDIENNVGSFSFVTDDRSPNAEGVFANDDVIIKYKDKVLMTGWVDKMIMTGGLDGRIVTVSGRDKIADLVDSSIPDSVKVFKGDVSLATVVQATIGALNMPFRVVDQVGVLPVKNQKVADAGERAMGFLAKLAARHQVWLVADENSNLQIMRAGDQSGDLRLFYLPSGNDKNNILSAEYAIDMSNVFKTVRVVGQTGASYGEVEYDKKKATAGDNVYTAPTAATKATKRVRLSDGTSIQGEATDSYARPSRYLEIKGSEVMTAADCAKRARDEVNSRRARAFVYKCKINFLESENGRILRIGDVIQLSDKVRNVSGKLIIAAFDVSFDIVGGTQVDLRLAPPEAYQIVDPQPDKIEYAKVPRVKKPKAAKAKKAGSDSSVF